MKISNFSQVKTNSKKKSDSKTLMSTPVILVCVHDLEDNQVVTHNMLYSIFAAYGNVLRILIFERSNTFKSFIEFDCLASANDAKKNLNRAFLCEGKYRISIYPSNLRTIKFQNNFPGGVDYTLPRQAFGMENGEPQQNLQQGGMMSPFRAFKANLLGPGASPKAYQEGGSSISSSTDLQSPSYSGSFVDEDRTNDDELLQMINRHHTESQLEECPPEEKSSDDEEDQDVEVDDFNNLVQNAFCKPSAFEVFGRERFLSHPPTRVDDSSSFSYLRKNRRFPTFPHPNFDMPASYEYNSFSNPSRMSTFSDHSMPGLYSMEDIPNGFEANDERIAQPFMNYISNGNFENICQFDQADIDNTSCDRGLSSRYGDNMSNGDNKENEEKKSAVLHVLGIENKEVTTKMLFNIFSTYGNILKLMFIKTRAVALVEFENVSNATKAKDCLNDVTFMGKPLRITYSKYPTIQLHSGQDEKYPDQLIVGDEKNFRFKEGKNVVIAQPSQVLHVSNLVKEVCKDKKALSNLFSPYGEIKAVKPLFGENGKNMCLIKMKSVEESLKAIAHLHDTEFNGRKIQISFSRSKL